MESKILFRLLSSIGTGASGGRDAVVDPRPPQADLQETKDRRLAVGMWHRTMPGDRTIRLEYRLRILCYVIFAPGFLLTLFLLWRAQTPWPVIAGTLGFLVVVFLIFMGMLVEEVVRPLQTMANVVASLREGNYSFRARGSQKADAWG